MIEHSETDEPAYDATTAFMQSDSPGATETPAPPATDPGSTGLPDAAPTGPPRDPSGRFAPKTPDDPATAAAPDGEPDAPATDDPAAPDAPPDLRTAPPTAPAPAETPYAFRHRNASHAIEGATVRADGAIVIPPAARERVELLLTRGREHETETPRRFQQLEQRAVQAEQRAQQTDVANRAFAELLSADLPDEEYLLRALELKQQLPGLRQRQLQERIAELEGRAAPQSQRQAPQGPTADDMAQVIAGRTEQTLLAVRQQLPEFKDFTDAELGTLYQQLQRRANLYVRQATELDAARYGVDIGDPVFDGDAFVAEVRLVAAPTLQQKQAAAAKAKQDAAIADAAKRNAAVTTTPKVPPVPKAGVTTTAGTAPRFKSQDDIDAWMARPGT